MNNEENPKKKYKIEIGDVVTIHRTDFRDITFYKIRLAKKNADGTFVEGWKNVRFPKGAEIPDKSKIRIIDMFEDFYNKDRFLTIFTLFIKEWEIVDIEQSYADYENYLSETSDEELPF